MVRGNTRLRGEEQTQSRVEKSHEVGFIGKAGRQVVREKPGSLGREKVKAKQTTLVRLGRGEESYRKGKGKVKEKYTGLVNLNGKGKY